MDFFNSWNWMDLSVKSRFEGRRLSRSAVIRPSFGML